MLYDFSLFGKSHQRIQRILFDARPGLLEALAAVAKSIATHTRQPLDYNRQCVAAGLGNLIGGFFQCAPK
jgi:MFS superfamily sulfate permease-like transporter